MEASATSVPASSWRAGAGTPEVDFGSIVIQPRRLDVLVHVLAFQQLAGENPPSVSAADWVSRSDELAALDHEPTVATIAAELMANPAVELRVEFASGGNLVRGATSAAAALVAGHPMVRGDESGHPATDRSVDGLIASGWSRQQIEELFIEWANRDDAFHVVLVDLDSDGAQNAIHELRCRYGELHSELAFVSPTESARLGASSHGSTQVLCLRVGPTSSLREVLGRHEHALRGSMGGRDGAKALSLLWARDRQSEASSSHRQRVRKNRRRQLIHQVLGRVGGR